MRRLIVFPLVALFLSTAAGPAALAQTPDYSCIRFLQRDARWILDRGVEASPTLARLAEAVCRADVIAYVRIEFGMGSNIAGDCGLISATPDHRFVIIRLSSDLRFGRDRIATLSHELEHALQIGRATWVRQPKDVLALQEILSPRAPHSATAERAEAATREDLAFARALRTRR